MSELLATIRDWIAAHTKEAEGAGSLQGGMIELAKVNALRAVEYEIQNAPSPWIDFRERRPEDGELIASVSLWRDGDSPDYWAGYYQEYNKPWPTRLIWRFWLPLPAPPSAEQIAGAMKGVAPLPSSPT